MSITVSLRGRVAACLVVFAFALIASAKVPFSQIPAVGPVQQWESPTRLAFLARIDRLIAFRASEIPISRSRSLYIAQSDAGSATGGGASGLSPLTPFLVRHMADVRALLAAELSNNTVVYFRQGDTFYAEPSNTVQGIAIPDSAACSFSSYLDPAAPSPDKPRLIAFRREPIDGWTTIAPGVIERSLPYSVYWVRGRLSESDASRGYRAQPYIKQPAADDVLLTPRSFYCSPEGLLRVNVGINAGDDLATLELACAQGPGFGISEAPAVRIDNLFIEGWGTDLPEQGDGAIRSSQTGDHTLLVSNCEWGWTAYHGLLHASAGTGGIVTLINCQFGLHTNRDTAHFGGGDGAVCYAPGGSNEFVLEHCTTFGGGLCRAGIPGADSNIQGSPVYMHTSGLTPVGIHVRRDCTFIPASPDRARYLGYAATPQGIVTLAGAVATQPSDPLDVRCYRSFILNETAEINGDQNGGAFKSIDINSRTRFIFHSGGGNQYLWGVGSNTRDGLSINRDLELYFPPGMTAYFALAQSQNQHRHVMLHNRIRITGASNLTPPSFFMTEVQPGRLDDSSVIACIISNETNRLSPMWTYANRPATSSQGGVSYTASFAMPAAPWTSTQSPIPLASAADFPMTAAASSLIPVSLIAQMPAGPGSVEYDILSRRRPSPSTIGPLEALPALCAADFNASGAVDFFDYLDFVDAFSLQLIDADFNNSGAIDFFDYLDFVDAFSIGC